MIAKARKTATRRAVRRKRRGKKVSVNETRIVTAAAKRKKKPASRKVAAKKNAAKKARRTSSALPRAAHTITGRDSAEDARVARHKARREYWSRFAVEHRTELDELIAALLAFFQRAFKADFEIRSRHHLVYVFELTAPRWSLFAPAINQLPLIQAKGFTLTPRQMERLNTVQDLAMQLLAGPGRTPMPSPILKGGRPPKSPPKPSDKSADLPRAGGDNDKPAVQPNERPSFFFELEGDGTNGDEVLFGREFWILFDYGVLKRRGLAVVKGKELDRLVRPDTRATLGIDIVPIGLTLLEGGAGQVMRFENGAKVGVPGFRLPGAGKTGCRAGAARRQRDLHR